MPRTISLETARRVVSDPRNGESYIQECQAILAAASDGPAPAPASVATPAAHAGSPDALLGLTSDGKALTIEACRSSGLDSLDFLSAPGVVLTDTGRTVKNMMVELAARDPKRQTLARASSLGIDVAAIRAACAIWNATHVSPHYDEEKAILAEIENLEIVAADRERTAAARF